MVDKTLAVESDRIEGRVRGDPGTDSWQLCGLRQVA